MLLQSLSARLSVNDDLQRAMRKALVVLGARTGATPEALSHATDELLEGRVAAVEALIDTTIDEHQAREDDRARAESCHQKAVLALFESIDRARGFYEQATDLDPDNPDYWNELGHILADQGDRRRATELYEKVRDYGERTGRELYRAKGYANLGTVAYRDGRLQEAGGVVSTVSRNWRGHRRLARSLWSICRTSLD